MSNQILLEGMFFTENSFQVKVMLRDPEIPYSLHGHEFYELVVVVSGSGTHLTIQGKHQLEEGSVFFVRPGALHGYENIDNLMLYNILIGKNLFSRNIFDLSEIPGFKSFFLQTQENIPILKLNTYQLSEVTALLKEIKKESEHLDFGRGSDTMTYAKLLQLIVLIARLDRAKPRASVQITQRISSIMAYMEQNLNRSISLHELMELSNMSASTLNRQFKTYTGWSPVEYHIHRRIAYSCSLLLSKPMSIEEISEATGFSDANYFSRQFRSLMHMSPKHYKKLWTQPIS